MVIRDGREDLSDKRRDGDFPDVRAAGAQDEIGQFDVAS
jgi:hypothetical protein